MRTAIETYVIDQIKELRHNHNMSQAELGFQLGVTAGFIGKVESPNSSAKYNLNHINKFAEIFDVSPQSLLPPKHLE